MKNKRYWFILLILPAVAGYLAIQNGLSRNAPGIAPSAIRETQTPEPLTETPSTAPTYEGCAYMWAYQDLPALSKKLDSSIRVFDADASANAYAFGEDCVYADGHRVFGAMETDFNVSLKVTDLTDEEAFGNWIADVMMVILQIPPEELSGPQPGFVEFRFVKSDSEQISLRVPLRDYPTVSAGKSGLELFRWFYLPLTSPT